MGLNLSPLQFAADPRNMEPSLGSPIDLAILVIVLFGLQLLATRTDFSTISKLSSMPVPATPTTLPVVTVQTETEPPVKPVVEKKKKRKRGKKSSPTTGSRAPSRVASPTPPSPVEPIVVVAAAVVESIAKQPKKSERQLRREAAQRLGRSLVRQFDQNVISKSINHKSYMILSGTVNTEGLPARRLDSQRRCKDGAACERLNCAYRHDTNPTPPRSRASSHDLTTPTLTPSPSLKSLSSSTRTSRSNSDATTRPCKFDVHCARPDCYFMHSNGRILDFDDLESTTTTTTSTTPISSASELDVFAAPFQPTQPIVAPVPVSDAGMDFLDEFLGEEMQQYRAEMELHQQQELQLLQTQPSFQVGTLGRQTESATASVPAPVPELNFEDMEPQTCYDELPAHTRRLIDLGLFEPPPATPIFSITILGENGETIALPDYPAPITISRGPSPPSSSAAATPAISRVPSHANLSILA